MNENNECLYGENCKYPDKIVRDDQPYSVRVLNGVKRKWHYKCYVLNSKGMYELSEAERKYLISAVLEKEPSPDGLPLLALRAIGYGK